MDGLVVLCGGLVLVATVIWLGLGALGALVQRVERAHPDPALPALGHSVRPGCEFDLLKYLTFQWQMARQRRVVANRRCRELRAVIRAMESQTAKVTPMSARRAR